MNNITKSIPYNKEIFEDITSIAKPFMKEFYKHQAVSLISGIGNEYAHTILTSEAFRNTFDVTTAMTTAIFAFHAHCILEDTPFDTEGHLTIRECQLLYLWHEEVCRWSDIDSKKTAHIMKAIVGSYNECYFHVKENDQIFASYLNKGLCEHWKEPKFHEVCREYIEKHNDLSIFDANEIYANKMNLKTEVL